MDITTAKTVAIIGAGVSGIATARQLIEQGLQCTLFERGDRVGGVWASGYVNFGVQVQRELYEYPDAPMPSDGATFTPGPEVQRYLEDYAARFGVLERVRFGSRVLALTQRDGAQGGWVLESETRGQRTREEYDLVVVANGLFSDRPHMPSFRGQERFRGRVLHISELTSHDLVRDKKVAIVGYGKSATDAAVESASCAAETTMIIREAHWPVPPKLAGILPFKWGMLTRLMSALIPLHYAASPAERALHGIGKPLVWLWWRVVELLLTVQCRLGSRLGSRTDLVPKTPVEVDAFGEAVMLPRPELYRLMRSGRITPLLTEIARFEESGPVLASGEALDVDVVILATGWETDHAFLPASTREALSFEHDGLYLHRQMLHPDVPDLVFIGHASTICSIATYSIQARWLRDLIRGRHRLPTVAEMKREIAALKRWKRAWMPSSRSRSARLLLHMLHYHDQLLRDLGANPRRKRGALAPFKEVFAPYQPSDYRSIVTGEWERSEQESNRPIPVALPAAAQAR